MVLFRPSTGGAQGSPWRAVRHKLRGFFGDWNPEKSKNARVLVGTVLVAGTLWSCGKRIPGGYVGFLQYRDGTISPGLWEEEAVVPFLPFYHKPVTMRVMPAYKKLRRIYTTKDNKEVEAAVRVRLQPKIAFIPEIYLRFGREFGRAFLNEELNIDLKSVIKEHTYAELVKNDENTDKIVDDLVARFQDAAAFHKIILTEVSVLFRNPDDEDDDD
ncbi:prohibitin family protein [Cystoisospora suis]|uniref:Prohibitin family protein n=1 Tax=Cystoisospora suis TaxID=483139 RepID=A0A2C6LAW9_9APIC|nr:prohibitin family protein [Cystoisospora suis]